MTLMPAEDAVLSRGMRLLSEGTYPSGRTVGELARQLGVDEESFRSRFADAADFYQQVADCYVEGCARPRTSEAQFARRGGDAARLFAMRAQSLAAASSDRAMRDWAATAASGRPQGGAEAAARALAGARELVLASAAAALNDMGLPSAEADAMGRLLVREFGLGPGDPVLDLRDDAGFAAVMSMVGRSVQGQLLSVAEGEITVGPAGGQPVTVTVAHLGSGQPLDPDELAAARKFAEEWVVPQLGGNDAAESAAGRPDGSADR